MSTEYQRLMQTIAKAYDFMRNCVELRQQMIAISGAKKLVFARNNDGDVQAVLSWPDGREITVIVTLIEIAKWTPREVPTRVSALMLDRLKKSLPVIA